MGTTNNPGFTIIETMLFLAITGVLVATMLVGVGTSINIQRYRDSVSSFKSFLQSQYSDITNVQNDRDDNWSCGSSAQTIQTGSLESRGQSDCVVLGRYIWISGGTTTVAMVTAYQTGAANGSDITALSNGYTLGLSTINQQTDELEWGTAIAWPTAGSGAQTPTTPRSIAILIVRSPESGSVYTFTADNPPPVENVTDATLKSMLVVGIVSIPSQQQRTICLDSQGLVLNANMAVFIHAYATSETSIETRSNDVIANLGGTTRC
jgi:type II secretory pathway pseudopilin PulG